MSVTVKRLSLARALGHLQPITAGAGQVQILRHALLHYEPGNNRPDVERLTIAATDCRLSLTVAVEAQGGSGEPFSALVPLDRLAAWVKSDWGEEVELGFAGGSLVAVGMTTASFACPLLVEDFPSIPSCDADLERVDLTEAADEMQRCFSLVAGPEKGHTTALTRYLYLFASGEELTLFAAGKGNRTAFARFGLGACPEGTLLAVSKECGGVLAKFPGAVSAAIGPQQTFFLGVDEERMPWELSEIRFEERGDPRRFLGAEQVAGSAFRDLPVLSDLLPVFEAMPEIESVPMKVVPDGERTLVQVTSDAESREGVIAAELPALWNLYPKELVLILGHIGRVAGTEHTIRLGVIEKVWGWRFEVLSPEGKFLAVAILAGLSRI